MRLDQFFKKRDKQKPAAKLKETSGKRPSEQKGLERTIAPKTFSEGRRILISPIISEKSTDLGANNQYVFRVAKEVNKTEVKKIVESLYNVKVVSVGIINVSRKRRRLGKTRGWTKGYKKAIVKVKTGQKIEVST